jgi:hypothetical protein
VYQRDTKLGWVAVCKASYSSHGVKILGYVSWRLAASCARLAVSWRHVEGVELASSLKSPVRTMQVGCFLAKVFKALVIYDEGIGRGFEYQDLEPNIPD